MPRRCSVCDHKQRPAIDRALVTRAAGYRSIAKRFRVSDSALFRHYYEHVPHALARASERAEDEHATDLMHELQGCMTRVRLLFDACDRWLRDASNPEQYDIGPRAEELRVTYLEPGAARKNGKRGIATRKTAKLSELLARLTEHEIEVTLVETKHADPRELVLKASNQLQSHLELLGQLIGKLQGRTTVNVLVMPQWREVRSAVMRALEPFPQARACVTAELNAIAESQHVQ